MKIAFKILICILCAAVIGGVVYAIYKLTDGFGGELSLFYVKHEDRQITGSDYSLLEIGSDEAETFEVVYPLSELGGKNRDYNVKVEAYEGKDDFHYSIGGVPFSFKKAKLTKGFEIEKNETGFTVRALTDDIQEMLSLIHDGAEISLFDFDYDNPLFQLVVSSDDGSTNIKIAFDIKDPRFTKIVLDTEEIIIVG